jgi:alpha-amylase
MLDMLEAFPAIRVSMHWSGQLLEWMEMHAPDQLARLFALAGAGRIEVVSGLWGGGMLPALPERDIVGQVSAMQRWWRSRAEIKPRGAWLPHHGWDPSAARILGRLGLQFTVLEETQFLPPVNPDGYYLTEREGTALALFCADTRLSRMIPDSAPRAILKGVAVRAKEGARCVVLSVSGEAFGAGLESSATRSFSGPKSWVRRFFAALTDNAHWIKLVSFGTVLDRMRPTDRAYPPASISLPLAIASLGPRGATFGELLSEARRGTDWQLERVAPYLHAPAWDQTLAHFPEINRLHKRMLRSSGEVARLRSAIREARRGDDDERADALEEATRALYRGQNGAAYVLGADVGAQDPAVRCQAWAGLLRAEYAVATALGEAGLTKVERADYDCDGRAEVLIQTPQLCAVVAPGSGGSLVELDAWTLPGNLLNVRTRREEPEHAEVRRGEALPKILVEDEKTASVEIIQEEEDTGEPSTDISELPSLRLAEQGLVDRLHYDRHVRYSFIDRFLGPEATPQNVRMGRFPEVGDFVGAEYQLLKLEEDDPSVVAVTVARDGNVTEGASPRLVRVMKRFGFFRETASFDVRYEVANRYHEPIRGRFAIELNLGLDGARGPGVFLETAADNRVALDEPGDHPDVTDLALADENRGYRLMIHLSAPARVWHFPIETVSRSPRGLSSVFQGICLLLWWPIELWGLERKRVNVNVALEA